MPGRKPSRPPTLAQIEKDERQRNNETKAISDNEIHEMLRPRGILERQPRTIIFLKRLARHGELPTTIVRQILGLTGNSVLKNVSKGSSLLGGMIAEGYVTKWLGIFHSRRSNWFKITPKGRVALKECPKKCDS